MIVAALVFSAAVADLSAKKTVTITETPASDSRIEYIGRTMVEGGTVSYDWAEVYFRVRFTGRKERHIELWVTLILAVMVRKAAIGMIRSLLRLRTAILLMLRSQPAISEPTGILTTRGIKRWPTV